MTASVTGAAMAAANTYVVNDAATLVLEGIGGVGRDVVQSSVSYALAAGTEIEELRTTNDKGKGALNLTGNDFAQTIVGNAGANVIDGKGGADTLYGGSGNDTFVLGKDAIMVPGSANIDHIMDYARGDVVDLTQTLNLAGGINAVSGGYLRVTTGGLIQVDLDGSANGWVTMSSINGTGSVSMRYLSGGLATTVLVDRVTEASAALSGPIEQVAIGSDALVHHAVASLDLWGLG
jgi:Ca2+-binding RTX toxin-like protein